MLILGMKRDEEVILTLADGTEILVTIKKTSPSLVRVGFTAPLTVNIVRREVLERERRRAGLSREAR